MATKELFFKSYGKDRKGGRWCKKVDGKLHYFGVGSCKSDLTSYRKAREAYHQFRDQQLVESQTESLARAFFRGRMKAVHGDRYEQELARVMSPTPVEDGLEREVSRVVPGPDDEGWDEASQPSLTDVMTLIERQARRSVVSQVSTQPGDLTMAEHIDAWLESQRQAWQNQEITEKSYVSKRYGIATFRDFVANAGFGTAQQVEQLLHDYRTLLLSHLQNGVYAGNTINDKLKFLRQFIKWCFERRVLSELPRSLEKVTKQVHVQKGGQPLTVSQVRRLWAQADDRMKAWMALGLNCGFKNRDIAELRGHDIIDGRLLTTRHKTTVPMNVKLWPMTCRLIEQTRQNGGDVSGHLYVNREGRPVTRDRSDNLGAAFRKLAKQVGVEATFQQLRDTGAEFVRRWNREQGRADGAVVQLYLAHRDSSTAQFYVSQDPKDAQAQILDDATDALGEWLSLSE